MQFISIVNGAYNPSTGTVQNTSTSYSVKMYKKHIKANQYFFPDLIDRDIAMFYLANNSLSFTPKVNDQIVSGSSTYSIKEIQEHSASGEVVLYRIIAVKG